MLACLFFPMTGKSADELFVFSLNLFSFTIRHGEIFCLFAFLSLLMHLLPHSVLMHTVAVVIRWEVGIILMLRRERIAITFQVAGL